MTSSRTHHALERKQRVSQLLCLMLCLVTWRGPLPCLHAHAAGPHIAERDVELATHCQQFHENVTSDQDLGWHFHLLSPWAKQQSDAAKSDTPQDPLLKNEVLLSSSASQAADAGLDLDGQVCLIPVCFHGEHNPISNAVRPVHSFLNSLLQSVPLCAVTGVALC